MYRLLFLLILIPNLVLGQNISVNEADYQRAERFLSQFTSPLVFQTRVSPNWMSDDQFWYKSNTKEGMQYVLVDLKKKSKDNLFNHQRLSNALGALTDTTYDASDLPIRDLNFSADRREATIHMDGISAQCNMRRYTCSEIPSRGTQRVASNSVSPSGLYQAYIKEHNLWLRNLDTGEERALTADGIEDYGYATNNAGWVRSNNPVLLWSPDSKKNCNLPTRCPRSWKNAPRIH